MNEAPDPLEALLSDLRPHEVSPGLRKRVAERLGAIPRPKNVGGHGGSSSSAAWPPLAWPRFFSGGGGDRGVEPMPIAVLPQPAPPVMVVDSGFTLLAYQRPSPAHPKTWMPCLRWTVLSPQNLIRSSRESLLSLGPMQHYVPY